MQSKIKFLSEFIGTASLLTIVVGSGIMGEQLSSGNVAIALLANSFATGFGLSVLILIFGAYSGAHFNPAVTLGDFIAKKKTLYEFLFYLFAQISGAIVGVLVAHIMFGEPQYLAFSPKIRAGFPQLFSEFIATFGLIFTIRAISKSNPSAIPYSVGAYIASAYWFTASTSFANPVVTLARALTPTFAGISPGNALGFCVAQLIGAIAGELLFRQFDRGIK